MSRSRSPVGWLLDRTTPLSGSGPSGLGLLLTTCSICFVVASVITGGLFAVGSLTLRVDVLVGAGAVATLTLTVTAATVVRSVSAAGPQMLTVATATTMVRAGCLIALGGFLAVDPNGGSGVWIPGAIYGLAIGLDGIDGQLARRRDAVTDLGRRLDTEIDAIAVLLGSVLVVVDGAAMLAFLLVGLARYAFVAGRWSRRLRGLPVYDLPESRVRRPLAAGAMIAIWLALLPVPGQSGSVLVTTALLVPFVVSFVRDWLAVSGRRWRL